MKTMVISHDGKTITKEEKIIERFSITTETLNAEDIPIEEIWNFMSDQEKRINEARINIECAKNILRIKGETVA